LAYYGKDFVKSRLLAARRSGTQMNYIHRRASICILLIKKIDWSLHAELKGPPAI
jgi:hypothetical protein